MDKYILLAFLLFTRNTSLAERREAPGEGAPRIQTLVASRFAHEAFRRSASSSLKPKTLVEGPFDGSRIVYRPPSLFTMLYHRRSHHPLV